MKKNANIISPKGKRKDAELFEENLVDGAWIPLGFAWDSPAEVSERAREIEEFAGEELGPGDQDAAPAKPKARDVTRRR